MNRIWGPLYTTAEDRDYVQTPKFSSVLFDGKTIVDKDVCHFLDWLYLGFFLQVNFQFVSKKEKKRKDREVCHKRMVYVIMTKWDRDIIILNYVFLLASHIHTQILKVQLPDLNTWSLFTSSLSTHWNDG